MDFGAMNIQLTMPKVPEVGQIQHNLTQQGVVQHDFETMRQKADTQLKEQQVRTREKMEDGRVKEDAGGNQGGYQGGASRGRNNREAEEPEEKMAVDTIRGRNIDIQF